MADKKLSQVTSEQFNPNEDDRVHVIHYVSGAWNSLYMKLSTLKSWVNSGASTGTGLTITDQSHTGAGSEMYQQAQYELIQTIIFKPTNPASTIKVGTALDDDYYLEETTTNQNIVNIYSTEALDADREIYVTVSGEATVKIVSILGL